MFALLGSRRLEQRVVMKLHGQRINASATSYRNNLVNGTQLEDDTRPPFEGVPG